MRVGVIEIMPHGHYTLVDSVSRIYASNLENEVFIFTHENGIPALDPITKELPNVKIVSTSIDNLFKELEKYNLQRAYIITLDKYFDQFSKFKQELPLFLFIHNVDDWFHSGFLDGIKKFISKFSFKRIVYDLKIHFIYPIWRKRLIKNIVRNKGRLIVLNPYVKDELKKYYPGEIDVIPFSVYNPAIIDKSEKQGLLRVCIPGMLSSVRRDYQSVFRILEEDLGFFKDKIIIDLLGGVAKQEGGETLIKEADRLISKGLKIRYYNKPIVLLEEFDEELSKAHIILGNMNVQLNKFSSYGKTKDSGIIFTLIHVGKPGLLPSQYPILKEVESSVLLFNNYGHLQEILKDLASNRNKVLELSEKAKANSLYYHPFEILKRLS